MSDKPFLKVAILQKPEGDNVRCLTCERQCLLRPGQRGWCKTRVNRGGVLFTTVYGAVSSISVNPIEKKPLFHFYPGSLSLTVGSWSCNFSCPWCQNWEISKRIGERQFMSPEDFVKMAVDLGCEGTSISFNEPTLLIEWSIEVFRLARNEGLYNTFVSNGYMTLQALKLLIEAGLDAINVDMKGDKEAVKNFCGADVEVVWRNCRYLKEQGVHLELTTLVIPGVNDSETTLKEIATRIAYELGAETPWHLTAYYPAYLFNAPSTPVEVLEKAYAIGKEVGLKFVYIGNVPGHPLENTYCPNCGQILIERYGVRTTRCYISKPICPNCGQSLPIVGLVGRVRRG